MSGEWCRWVFDGDGVKNFQHPCSLGRPVFSGERAGEPEGFGWHAEGPGETGPGKGSNKVSWTLKIPQV